MVKPGFELKVSLTSEFWESRPVPPLLDLKASFKGQIDQYYQEGSADCSPDLKVVTQGPPSLVMKADFDELCVWVAVRTRGRKPQEPRSGSPTLWRGGEGGERVRRDLSLQ